MARMFPSQSAFGVAPGASLKTQHSDKIPFYSFLLRGIIFTAEDFLSVALSSIYMQLLKS